MVKVPCAGISEGKRRKPMGTLGRISSF
uniref:Uncharacterized protein n=1 Tax=Anguilla anguilla TaxID=7936 RepID=A0A0E9XHJ8_ANGAN